MKPVHFSFCGLVGIFTLMATGADVARPDSAHEIIRYKSPAGWKAADQPGQPTKVYLSPNSTPVNQAFIVIALTPAEANFDFPATFDKTIKASVPNAKITESTPATPAKTRQGFDALSQTLVGQNAAGQKLHVRMVGARVNDRMAAFCLMASDKGLYDRSQADMDALLQSVSFDAAAPAAANANPEWAALEQRKQKLLQEIAEIEAKQSQLKGAPAAVAAAAPANAAVGVPARDPGEHLKKAMAQFSKDADGRRKPNMIVGDILTLDGKPIPEVALYSLYCGGTTIAGERTHLNLEVDERGHFEQKLPDGLYRVSASCIVNYAGHRVPVDLVSLDGKPMGTNHASDKGVVKDFRMIMGGLKPGENPDSVIGYFGGVVTLADGSVDPGNNFQMRFPGSKVRVTFTPTGLLLDGSNGQPFTIEITSHQLDYGSGRIQQIPLGVYRLSGWLALPNGQTKPLGLSKDFNGPFANQFEVFWESGEGDPQARSEPRVFLRD